MARIHGFIFLFSVMSISAYKYRQNDQQDSPHSHPQKYLADEPNRMSERSIHNTDHNQRLQSRSSTKIEEASRTENGTFKILNKPFSIHRRFAQTDDSPGDRVVFPGLTSRSGVNPYVPEIPESCKKIGICDEIPNYPREQVKKIVAKLGEKTEFQFDKLDLPSIPDIAQRAGSFEDSYELCDFRVKIMTPLAAQSDDLKWYHVLNFNENPLQGFRVEICNTTSTGCAKFVTMENNYNPKCVQKFIFRKMKILSESGEMIERSMKVPSCCSCVATLLG
ncbi:protein spaetzle-like [Bombyx mandarina]|uniref:Protein spaetzle-like n=1 Tax=Bombyx mandarina TaxID=7092 RepID=A0A6J2JTK4_BOMMA|nr:protein spaetzle-like [Bombyx mandarina]